MKSIYMYTTSSCFKCKMAKKYLNEQGVKVLEKVVDKDPKYMEDMRKMNIASVPVLVCEEMIVTDNSKASLDKIIAYAKEAI